MLVRVGNLLDRSSRALVVIAGLFLVAAAGAVDYATGAELGFSIFYAAPVAAVAWSVSRRAGLWMAGIAAAVWLLVDVLAGAPVSSQSVHAWNAVDRLAFFLLLAEILARLRAEIRRAERLLAEDRLTGLPNASEFEDRLGRMRSGLGPESLLVLRVDVGELDYINERFGRDAGDHLIVAMAREVVATLPRDTLVARIGGSRFMAAEPGIPVEPARRVVDGLYGGLLDRLRALDRPASVEVAAAYWRRPTGSVGSLLQHVDRLAPSTASGARGPIFDEV